MTQLSSDEARLELHRKTQEEARAKKRAFSSKQKYFRLTSMELDPILQAIQRHVTGSSKTKKIQVQPGVFVNVGGLRLRTFAEKGCTCVSCGLEATHFAVERDHAQEAVNGKYHFNLYGVLDNGTEMLFTHDHKLARSLGGRDHIDNTQTMCYRCNAKKSAQESMIHNVRGKVAPTKIQSMIAAVVNYKYGVEVNKNLDV